MGKKRMGGLKRVGLGGGTLYSGYSRTTKFAAFMRYRAQ